MGNEVKPCKHGRNFCMECHYDKDALRAQLEALRAENGRLSSAHDDMCRKAAWYAEREEKARAELEALRSQHAERQEAVAVCMGCVDQASRIRELEHKMDYYTSATLAQDVSGLVEALEPLGERIAKVWIGHLHNDELVTIQRELDAALAAYRKESGQ